MAGKKVNLDKSCAFFSTNTIPSVKEEILSALWVGEAKGDERYLGNPLFVSRNKVKDFSFLKEKLWKRLEGWNAKFLPRAGRTTLVNAVALNIPSYSMSAFRIRLSLCQEWMPRSRDFGGTWKGVTSWLSRRGMSYVGANEQSPWVSLLREKYCRSEDFWSRPVKHGDSYVWQGILKARDVIQSGACVAIGDGMSQHIWFSSRRTLKVDNIQSADIRDFISWLLSKSKEPGFEDFLLFVGCTLDCIWRWRNELVFSGGRCDVSTMISQITRCLQSRPNWPPPPIGTIAISVDASVVECKVGLSALARDHQGEVIDILVGQSHVDLVLEGELKGILMGVRLASEKGWSAVIIQSDCKMAVDALVSKENPPHWLVRGLFSDVLSLSSSLVCLKFFLYS
ncbi:uncharacterized protein LOC112095413 [Morus notabilis]|uniref:uncharacterized protein LOC112095413 n=1 Tax=Morus notabilis TaxID=981085 RepID=UPI000CECE7B9|nr:uncharacterized protein LOC112095413 [Morus notabilis]